MKSELVENSMFQPTRNIMLWLVCWQRAELIGRARKKLSPFMPANYPEVANFRALCLSIRRKSWS